MKFLLSLVLACICAAAAEAAPHAGVILWSNNLDSVADVQMGSGAGQLFNDPVRGAALLITNHDPAQTAVRTFVLPIEKLRGCFVFAGAEVKADGVSAKPQSWNGIKLMLQLDTPAGRQWPQADVSSGSFDWKHVSTRVLVPSNAIAATLVVGLEQVSGRVEFDNLRCTLARKIEAIPPAPRDQPIFLGHAEPRLRGAMIAPASLSENDLSVLARGWGANLVRWQFIRSNAQASEAGFGAYDRWLESELGRLDRGLMWAANMGVKVVVDLHSPPGGRPIDGGYQAAIGSLWTDPSAQAKFVEVWRNIAKHYKGDRRIWGYDLVNEPDDNNVTEDCDDWQGLALKAGRAVREIDPGCTLIIEPPSWGSPEGFAGFEPVPLTNVVYSFHMYNPHDFTHQGVFGPSDPIAYPGRIAGAMWNRGVLEKSMSPATEFARRYRVQMYVGEFSAIRWAPGAETYLDDLLSLIESHGWDWSYHAFREWDGWSVEHGTNKDDHKPSAEPTARQKVLLKWLKAGADKQ